MNPEIVELGTDLAIWTITGTFAGALVGLMAGVAKEHLMTSDGRLTEEQKIEVSVNIPAKYTKIGVLAGLLATIASQTL